MFRIAPCLALAVCLGLASCAAAGPSGPDGGRLRACPGSPNCVNSEEGSAPPLPVIGEDGWARLREAIVSLGGSIEREEGGYLHATFRSRLFGFMDDLECRRDGDVVQVRSASRTGWWDLGVNRRRVESLRRALGDATGK
ncbi:DUF1499 domain-containing protein [Desulfomicrobium escambiense]|uniref:DUF1499 domain-containing protein n=1 Tax=Desulfomicrobium escambiense TaxID=29503 RepID=UPI00040CA786|nr:DUF1499 domain-containing protein [Desulfomicrobium escambiense]